jgi:hypothetical protein
VVEIDSHQQGLREEGLSISRYVLLALADNNPLGSRGVECSRKCTGLNCNYCTLVRGCESRRERDRVEGLPPPLQGQLEAVAAAGSGCLGINAGSNSIGARGCQHLARAHWTSLQVIYLCCHAANQPTTTSESKAAGI